MHWEYESAWRAAGSTLAHGENNREERLGLEWLFPCLSTLLKQIIFDDAQGLTASLPEILSPDDRLAIRRSRVPRGHTRYFYVSVCDT